MKIKLFVIISLISLLFLSCASTDEGEKTEVKSPEPEVEDIVIDNTVEDFDLEVEDVLDEDIVVIEEDDEYLRSVNVIEDVSREEFDEDKAAILQIISELSDAMENFNFDKWKSYIAAESIEYYSNPANLRKVQKKLPDKTIQLKGLKDYFKHVFIPSREQSKVDEIRYISKTNTKAVEVKGDGTLVVYYYFIKEKNKWMVTLPKEN